MAAFFTELTGTGLIAVRGAGAAAFLQSQLTSDIAGMTLPRTQYSGYCSPKGRLIATFLVWRRDDEFLLQLPDTLRESVRERLTKYVLRAQVQIASAPQPLFGVWGNDAMRVLSSFAGRLPEHNHEAVDSPQQCVTRLPVDRYLVLVPAERAEAVRASLRSTASAQAESAWAALDIEAGIPVITETAQDQYVPQMVNLDLIGAVSYTKGCYPGQEIVARMHYLGRLKQRMYRVRVSGAADPLPGDPLFSAAFGPEQASGALLNVTAAGSAGHDALAVIQTGSVGAGAVHWKSPDGPAVEFHALPYAIPA